MGGLALRTGISHVLERTRVIGAADVQVRLRLEGGDRREEEEGLEIISNGRGN